MDFGKTLKTVVFLRNDEAFEIGNVESEAGLHTFAFLKAIYTVLVHKKQVTKLAINRTMLLGFLQSNLVNLYPNYEV